MPDRSVSVAIKAEVSGFVAGIKTAQANVTAFNAQLEKSAAKRQALSQLGSAAGKVGLVAAAGLGAAVMASANFDQAMSKVEAATHESASAMQDLREAALKAGADTAFSASEAAQGIEALAKAGVNTSEILGGGLAGALDLAAAGEMEVGAAAEAAAGAMAQFKLEGSEVPHIADLLAAAAGKAQGEVSDMVMALKQAGTVASQTGLSLEETTGTLAAMAEQSLLGSDAGTSFKTMLAALTPNSVKAASAMEQYNIHAFDAQGNFIGMTELAGQLRDGLGKLTDEQRAMTLETIFGSDAVRAAAIIYDNGAEGIQSWIDKTDDAGYAAETAAIKLDNLAGDLEALKGSLETALIGTGDGAQGPLRSLVQGLTDVINKFNELPPAAKNATTGLLAVTAVTGGSLWFGAKVVGGIVETKNAINELAITSPRAAGALGKLGKAAGIAGAALGALALVDAIQNSSVDAVPGVQQLTASLLDLSHAATDAAMQDAKDSLEDLLTVTNERSWAPDKVYEFADSLERLADPNLAQSLQDNLSGMLGGLGGGSELEAAKSQIEGLDAALTNIAMTGGAEEAGRALDSFAEAAGLSGSEVDTLMGLLPGYKEALAGAAVSADAVAGATEDLTGATHAGASATDNYTTALIKNTDAMEDRRSAALEAFDAETAWRNALKDATEAGKKNNAGIKGSSDAALENRDKISALAQAWNNQTDAVQNAKGNFAEARRAFIDTAIAMGVPERAAERLAKKLLEIPSKRVTAVVVETGGAITALNGLEARLRNFAQSTYTTTAHVASGVPLPGRAAGGPVSAGRTYMVGEQGPEILTMATSGRVFSNPESRRMIAAGVGSSGGSDVGLAAEVAALRAELARLPGAVQAGSYAGSRDGTEGRLRMRDSQTYLAMGG